MIPNVGPMELLVVLIVALVVFGPKRLPELGNSLGRGIRDFKEGIRGEDTQSPREPEALQAARVDAVAAAPAVEEDQPLR